MSTSITGRLQTTVPISNSTATVTQASSGSNVFDGNIALRNQSNDLVRFRVLERYETSTVKVVMEVRRGATWTSTGVEFDSGFTPT